MRITVSLLMAVVCLAFTTKATAGSIPDADECDVDWWDDLGGVYLCPDEPDPSPGTEVVVTIRNSDHQPIYQIFVNVEDVYDDMGECSGAAHGGDTNALGKYPFVGAGGDCDDNPLVTFHDIGAGIFVIRSFEVAKSPDFNGGYGDGTVDLLDFQYFAFGHRGGNAPCHDYDNNGAVGLSDVVLFGAAFDAANSCN